jgi:hypothetical protein
MDHDIHSVEIFLLLDLPPIREQILVPVVVVVVEAEGAVFSVRIVLLVVVVWAAVWPGFHQLNS